jgi:ketosteroid isomerase-like protein|tara:strand:- start:274 stop:651 length:378 start_codon:yes stop_codon:yes gene_type:complete
MTPTEICLKEFELFEKGDMEEWANLCSPDYVFKAAGNLPWSGTFHGVDDVIENCFSVLAENLPDLKMTILQTWEVDGTVFLKIQANSELFDEPIENLHMEIISDGKIVFAQTFDDSQKIAEALAE